MDGAERDFSIEREQKAAKARPDTHRLPGETPTQPEAGDPTQERANDFPDRIRRKYYVVKTKPDRELEVAEVRVYTDQRGEYLAFKDAGDRLSTRLESPQIVRDMVSVAEHRGWEAIVVRGSAEFRREVWVEASSRGIEVRGYEPADLDRAARDKLAEPTAPARREAVTSSSQQDRAARSQNASEAPRFDYEAGVSGRLVEVGTAPFRNRNGAKPSPYLDLGLEGGRSHRIWGAGLRAAIEQGGAKMGDQVTVRRDGFNIVAGSGHGAGEGDGNASTARQGLRRDRWTVVAERFRTLDRSEAVRDPVLAAAHSQIAVIERGAKAVFPKDERSQAIIVTAARDRAAEHLAAGRPLRRAEIRSSEREPAHAHPKREKSRERTRDRDRGRER